MKTGFKMTHHHMNIFQHPNTPSTHKKKQERWLWRCATCYQLSKKAYTPETNTVIPDKGPPTHPIMDNIEINREGIKNQLKI